MLYPTLRWSGCVLALTILPNVAWADFTPSMALHKYFDMTASLGLSINVGGRANTDDNVRWTDIILTDDRLDTTIHVDWVEASPVGADTVRILWGPETTIVSDVEDIQEDLKLFVLPENFEILVTENGDLLSYAFSADGLKIFTTDNDAPLNVDFSLMEVTGAYSVVEETRVDGSMSTGPWQLDYSSNDDGFSFSYDGDIASSIMSFGMDLTKSDNRTGYFDGTHGFNLAYDFTDVSITSSLNALNFTNSIRSKAAHTTGQFILKDRNLLGSAESKDVTYAFRLGDEDETEIVAIAESFSAKINASVRDVGETAPFELNVELDKINLSDEAWLHLDPDGMIKHEPSTFKLDFSSDLVWLSDDFRPDKNGEVVRMKSMDLNEFALEFGGARLNASGSGNYALFPFYPSGQINIETHNIRALVENLSKLGVISPVNAFLFRGLLPKFTLPGPDGSNHRITEIVANPDGSIAINGNRIR